MPKLSLFKQNRPFCIYIYIYNFFGGGGGGRENQSQGMNISGLRAVGRYEIVKYLYKSGGRSCNVSRDFCRRTSFGAYLFVEPDDEWSSFYQSKNSCG